MAVAAPDSPVVYWFRQDLRLADLPGLQAAMKTGRPVLPCYVLDDAAPGEWRLGGASRWWLHHSLSSLTDSISELGGQLLLRRGDTGEVLRQLVAETGASGVYCSRQYEPWASALEQRVYASLAEVDVPLRRYAGTLLFEPEQVHNQQNLPYRVFTPFWRACRSQHTLPAPVGPLPDTLWYASPAASGMPLASLGLLPTQPDWAAGWERLWQPGENGAATRLERFLASTLADYSEGRDFPMRDATSRLSPHVHFGEVSVARICAEAAALGAREPALQAQVDKFLSEVGWREFSHHLLHHFARIPEDAFNAKFDKFPWLGTAEQLRLWQRGMTGYPLVDAGMRELWQTGYMHNRVRMVVASFLCKHPLLDWRAGQRWFWDTLVDADLANNACSWQWVAGSGADAAPYFRIFNPIAQGKKFDKQGEYIRRWVPEIAALPDKSLHAPWEAPEDLLDHCGVVLGETYPSPMVEHAAARESALQAYHSLQ